MLFIPLLGGCEAPYSTLSPVGPSAQMAANLWWGMFALFSLVMVAVIALWVIAHRRDPGRQSPDQQQQVQQRWIIGGGLMLPLASIIVILAFGIPAGHRMLPLPLDDGEPLVIEVTGHQWFFSVHYPEHDINLVDELHIPAGVPIDVRLKSADVIHAFWVPRLAGKVDMIPGHTNTLRLQADAPGVYRGHCAEFCGTRHAHMQFHVHAHSAQDYAAWLSETAADD